MDRLWAPWRLSYVTGGDKPDGADACFICQGLAADADRDNLIAFRGQTSVLVLNRFPYNNGHLLIAPRAHKGQLAELTTDEILETQQLLTRSLGWLSDILKPHGYNIGLNLGRAA